LQINYKTYFNNFILVVDKLFISCGHIVSYILVLYFSKSFITYVIIVLEKSIVVNVKSYEYIFSYKNLSRISLFFSFIAYFQSFIAHKINTSTCHLVIREFFIS